MRPIRMEMAAFGPYIEKCEIDFSRFGESGLYLITGNTGSGKSTIFDAITYALFDDTSGSERKINMLINQFVNDASKTYVELDFLYAGKRYRIRRKPAYKVLKKKAADSSKRTEKDFSSKKGEVDFYVYDENLQDYVPFKDLHKVSEINQAIRELLGMDRQQFVQIAMIAQGEFLKLLTATSTERAEILRGIFSTGKYAEVESRLKAECNRLKDGIQLCRNELDSVIQGLHQAGLHQVGLHQAEMTSDGDYAMNVSRLSEAIRDGRVQMEQYQADAERRKAEMDGLISEIAVAEKLSETEKTLRKEREHLEAAQEKLPEKERAYSEKGRLEERIEAIKETVIVKREGLLKFDELSADLESERKLCSEIREQLEDCKSRTRKQEKRLLELRHEAEGLAHVNQSLDKECRVKDELERKAKTLSEDLNLALECANLLEKHESSYAVFCSLEEQWSREEVRVQNLYRAYMHSQAGRLALELKDGFPCPVCGSLHHPDIATLQDHAPGEEEVKKAQDALKESFRQLQDQKNICVKWKGELEAAEKILRRNLEERGLSFSDGELSGDKMREVLNRLESARAGIHADIVASAVLISELESAKNCADGIETKIRESERLCVELRGRVIELSANLAASEKSVEAVRQRQERLRETLGLSDVNEARGEIARLEEEKRLRESELKIVVEEYAQLKDEISIAKTAVETLSRELEGKEHRDLDTLYERRTEKKAQLEKLESENTTLEKNLHVYRLALEQMRRKVEELDALEKELRWKKELADTATGSLSGSDKVGFEMYAQFAYFERVLERANGRLFRMTGGQYRLERVQSDDAFDIGKGGRSKLGLDLAVMDFHTGEKRSVKSLSGGESFMASLSLALGMSDEVQSGAGGVHIDTLFVDEGFGTLDEQTLSNAMRVLSELSAGSLLVGIISHVGELKKRIDRQILVSKKRDGGSTVSVIVDAV